MPADRALADAWLERVVERHMRELRPAEFLKAVRALSVRYVEKRGTLTTRSPTDTAGKRAAFAGFFAPLHFLTARQVVRALHAGDVDLATVLDLGCGTGVASAAWALECHPRSPRLHGVDTQTWTKQEAGWTWRQLGLDGRAESADLVAFAERRLGGLASPAIAHTGIVLGWTANELSGNARARLRQALLEAALRGASILMIEPLARSVTPWWDDWAAVVTAQGGRADEWRFDVDLPSEIARLDEAAGFRRTELGARSLWLHGPRVS